VNILSFVDTTYRQIADIRQMSNAGEDNYEGRTHNPISHVSSTGELETGIHFCVHFAGHITWTSPPNERPEESLSITHFSFICYQMLYSLPDELLVTIVEGCDQKTRKSLSLVSRRLRNPSQCIMFKEVWISRETFENSVPGFAVEGGEHLPEVMQNDRLISYIQTFVISLSGAPHLLKTNIILTALHQMQQLRDIKLFSIPLTTTMLDWLCEVLSTRLYNVELWSCSYPADYTIQQGTLKIHALRVERTSIAPSPTADKVLSAIIERSSSSLASLSLPSGTEVFAHLGRMPRLTSLNIPYWPARRDGVLRNFLVANPQLVKFGLAGNTYDPADLPPSVLPNLGTIRVATEMIQHVLPGRPVAKVEIHDSPKVKIMMDGLHALSRSAAPIVELTLHLHHYSTSLDQILDVVVKSAPRLERIWLSFYTEVRSILY
jgi:hypothetical protein